MYNSTQRFSNHLDQTLFSYLESIFLIIRRHKVHEDSEFDDFQYFSVVFAVRSPLLSVISFPN